MSEVATKEKITLSDSVKSGIDHWVAKFPADQKQSASLQALRITQEDNGGWLTEPLMEAVAEYLDMPAIAVFEVATFYGMYDLKPTGKHKIYVCDNVSCMLRGSDEVIEHIEGKLGVKVGETTADGKFTLKTAECLGACCNAPMMQVDKTYHMDLTSEKIDTILQEVGSE